MQNFKKIDRKKKTKLFSIENFIHCFCARLYSRSSRKRQNRIGFMFQWFSRRAEHSTTLTLYDSKFHFKLTQSSIVTTQQENLIWDGTFFILYSVYWLYLRFCHFSIVLGICRLVKENANVTGTALLSCKSNYNDQLVMKVTSYNQCVLDCCLQLKLRRNTELQV